MTWGMDFLQTTPARLVLGLAGLAILTAIGVYVVRRFRDGTEEAETSSAVLSKFRESQHRGVLSEAEFRTIKTILAKRMQAELKQKDESGYDGPVDAPEGR